MRVPSCLLVGSQPLSPSAQLQTPLLCPVLSRCWYFSLLAIVPSSSFTSVLGSDLQSDPGVVGTNWILFLLSRDIFLL